MKLRLLKEDFVKPLKAYNKKKITTCQAFESTQQEKHNASKNFGLKKKSSCNI